MVSIYDFSANALRGGLVEMSEYRGKVVLIVNTASKCGLTPQYKGLEALYNEFSDRGFVVLGFPCNQFGAQESGSSEQISEFCEINYGVSFPMFEKIKVNGPNAHPLYKFLKSQKGSILGNDIKWNFAKFLVGKDGSVIKRYAPTDLPNSLSKDIQIALNA